MQNKIQDAKTQPASKGAAGTDRVSYASRRGNVVMLQWDTRGTSQGNRAPRRIAPN